MDFSRTRKDDTFFLEIFFPGAYLRKKGKEYSTDDAIEEKKGLIAVTIMIIVYMLNSEYGLE